MDPRFKGRLEVSVAEAWDRLEKAVIDNATAAQVFYCMFVRDSVLIAHLFSYALCPCPCYSFCN